MKIECLITPRQATELVSYIKAGRPNDWHRCCLGPVFLLALSTGPDGETCTYAMTAEGKWRELGHVGDGCIRELRREPKC